MEDRINQILTKCSETEKDEISILNAAFKENLDAYKKDRSANKLRDWREAKKALMETVDMLWAKYFEEAEPFKSRIDVVNFLQQEGFKIKKSKLYQDADKGFLKVQPDGTVRHSDVKDYILVAGLKKVDDKSGKLTAEQLQKVKNEDRKLQLTNEKLQFELDQLHEKYILKTDVQTEIAIKIGAMESGFKHLVRMKAADWIYTVGGDPNKAGILTDLMYAAYDELLNEFGNMEELKVTVQKRSNEKYST